MRVDLWWALGPVSLELGGSLSGDVSGCSECTCCWRGAGASPPGSAAPFVGRTWGSRLTGSGFTELSSPGVCRSDAAVSRTLARAGAATRPRVSTGKGAPRDPGVTWGGPDLAFSESVYPGCVHIFPWHVRLNLMSPTNTGLQQDKSIVLICAESTYAPVLKKQHCSECLTFRLNMLLTRKR